MTLGLGIVTVLARTRTISWRTVSVVFGLAIPWAFSISIFTAWFAGLIGLDPGDHGSSIALAGLLEESLKLAPLILVCLVAPGRVRRFAAVDWGLLGFALGAGFVVAEDGARRLYEPGLLALLVGFDGGLPYSVNPWQSGLFTSFDGVAVAAGHHVWTSNIAMGIALGLVLWRAGPGRVRRWWAWVPPLVLLGAAVSDHCAYNAYVSLAGWPNTPGDGFPTWMWLLWVIGLKGRLAVIAGPLIFLVCLLADAHLRAASGRFGRTAADAPEITFPELAHLHTALRAPLRAGVALATAS